MNQSTSLPVFPDDFAAFPPEARAWLFAAGSPIPDENKASILDGLHDSISKWKSHGTEIMAKATFLDDVTFLVVADFTQAHMSGCSIDRMILSVRETGALTGIDLLDAKGIHYWDHTGLHFVSRTKFGELAAVGAVDAGTMVLDLTRITLSDVRDGKWKAPAGTTWHRRAFELSAPA
ncbi:MAG: hypothetical protein AAB214_09965 [Fibrobacterota bacterium]